MTTVLRSRSGRMRAPLAATFAACATLAAAAGLDRPLEIVLEDQFRNRRDTAQLRGDVVVLVYAERHGAEAAVELGRRLHLHFHPAAEQAEATEWSTQPVVRPAGWPAGVRVPDVHVVPVACVPEVPKPLHAVARSRLRKESPHVSVWLDFDDVMRDHFQLVPAAPNVALIDTTGRPHGSTAGPFDAAGYAELVRVIDALRTHALPALRAAAVPDGVRPASATR